MANLADAQSDQGSRDRARQSVGQLSGHAYDMTATSTLRLVVGAGLVCAGLWSVVLSVIAA